MDAETHIKMALSNSSLTEELATLRGLVKKYLQGDRGSGPCAPLSRLTLALHVYGAPAAPPCPKGVIGDTDMMHNVCTGQHLSTGYWGFHWYCPVHGGAGEVLLADIVPGRMNNYGEPSRETVVARSINGN